jgi:hypothetical protein
MKKITRHLQVTSCLLPDRIKIQIGDIFPLLGMDELKAARASEVAL